MSIIEYLFGTALQELALGFLCALFFALISKAK